MPRASADVHLPLAPAAAAALAGSVGEPHVRVPPFVRGGHVGWRFDPEGDGTLVVLTFGYDVEPGWLRHLTTEVTQWSLARRLRRHLEAVRRASTGPDRAGRA